MRYLHTYFFLFLQLVFSVTLFGNTIHPLNLFESGLNLGYWSGHHQYRGEQNSYSTWAGNANAEWLSSWSPGYVQPISISIEQPDKAVQNVRNQLSKMGSCQQPYFLMKEAILDLGIALGMALVETNYSCSSCLKTQLQQAAVATQTLGQVLGDYQWQNLTQEINATSSGINSLLQNIAARDQNRGLATTIQRYIDIVSRLLPNVTLSCKEESKQEQNDPVITEKNPSSDSEIKKQNRRAYLTGGATTARLYGDNGTVSMPGSGLYVALEVAYGDPIFFLGGASFYRNAAGSEYFIPGVGQIGDPGEFLQSFQLHLGLGAHIITQEQLGVAVFGNGRLFTNPAIDGKYLSQGNTITNDNSIAINLGTYIRYGIFCLHTSYSLGMLPIITVNGEEMRYRMWQFGLGISL